MAKNTLPPGLTMMPDGNLGVELGLDQFGYFTITPERIRDITLANHIVSGPGVIKTFMPTSAELGIVLDMMTHAVNRGQMIDFGYWPNDMIREVGTRGGTLYCEDALGMPFQTPWIFLHSWDDPKLPYSAFEKAHAGVLQEMGFSLPGNGGKQTCAYLVNPFPKSATDPKQLCIDFEVMCFEGIQMPKGYGFRYLGIGDRATLHGKESREAGYYACNVIPYAWRWPLDNPEFHALITNRNNDDVLHAACGNVLDPTMVALMLLNARNVKQTTISQERLNKARVKSNKPPIPPYRRVDSHSYVTAIMNQLEPQKRGPGTGTHASPIMHLRRGHWRHFQTGEKSFIHETLVNASEDAKMQFISGRSHYKMDDEPR